MSVSLRIVSRTFCCDSCVRGIMKNKRTKVGSFERKLIHWGQLLASDHVDSKARQMLGLSGEKDAFVIKHVFSGLVCLYAVSSKDGTDTEVCIRDFAGIPGDRKSKDINMYSDQSGEIRLDVKTSASYMTRANPESRKPTL